MPNTIKAYPAKAMLVILSALISGCATQLTNEAHQIMTIRDGAVIAMMNYIELGFVTGDSGIWGGTYGLDSAYANAKNNAGKLPGANAMLITSSRMNPASFVSAKVYNCSDTKPQKVDIVNQHVPTSKSQEDTIWPE